MRILFALLVTSAVCVAQPGPYPSSPQFSGTVTAATLSATSVMVSNSITAPAFVGANYYDRKHFSRFTHCLNTPASWWDSSVRFGTGESDGVWGLVAPMTYGIWGIATGTSVGGGCGFFSYSGIALGNQMTITNKFRFQVSGFPTAANPYILRYGYCTPGSTVVTNTAEPANGFYLKLQTNGAGGLMMGLWCSKSSTAVSNLCAQTYYPATWYEGRLAVDAATNVYFSIGSNSTQTIESVTPIAAALVPTGTSLGTAFGVVNSGSGTTSYTVLLDYVEESGAFIFNQ